MTIVGDAVLRPLLMQLDKKKYDLSSFFAVGNGGAPLTPAVRAMAVERIPNLVISDSAGSSETGAQMHVTSMDDVAVGSFLPGPGTLVVDETLSRVLEPGHEGNGWLAQTGNVPLGYLGDPDKTARTFPVIDGVRYSIPGDRARHRGRRADRAAGARLGDGELGRREDLRRGGGAGHRRPSGRGRRGRDGPALGALGPGGRGRRAVGRGRRATAASVVEEASAHIARYKLPKAVVFVDLIQRSPSGKADYRWAAETAVAAAASAAARLITGSSAGGGAGRGRTDRRLVLRPFTDVDRAVLRAEHPSAGRRVAGLLADAGPSATPSSTSSWTRWTARGLGPLGGRHCRRPHIRGRGRAAPGDSGAAVLAGGRGRLAAPPRPLGPRLRHRSSAGGTGLRLQGGRARRDRCLHRHAQHALAGGDGALGMVRDVAGDFDHPGLPEGSPLRRHVLYRISAVVLVTGRP